jgi:hypothetical protein
VNVVLTQFIACLLSLDQLLLSTAERYEAALVLLLIPPEHIEEDVPAATASPQPSRKWTRLACQRFVLLRLSRRRSCSDDGLSAMPWRAGSDEVPLQARNRL